MEIFQIQYINVKVNEFERKNDDIFIWLGHTLNIVKFTSRSNNGVYIESF